MSGAGKRNELGLAMDSRMQPLASAESALVVQRDLTLLLDARSPRATEAREAILPFADLEKMPGDVHTYRITPLSIWNARAAGRSTASMIQALRTHSRGQVPEDVAAAIEDLGERYGRTRIVPRGDGLALHLDDPVLARVLLGNWRIASLLGSPLDDGGFRIEKGARGTLKQALLEAGYPVEDEAGYEGGESLRLGLRDRGSLRDYQLEAAGAFLRSGSGVVVLPCGAGKTFVGIAAMAALGESTLVLTTSRTSVSQWRRELLDRTDIPADAIAEYTGDSKETGPVTLSTYQILTWRPDREGEFPHFALFGARSWGLIIYDEVHLVPAPVFRITAELQSRRRLGLTGTLVREDGREGDAFALIGPRRYDVPWRELETDGYIATAECTEVRVPQDPDRRMAYALAPGRQRFRVAAENPRKISVVQQILNALPDSRILVIGEYISQLEALASKLRLPLVTGKLPQEERERIYDDFRRGTTTGIVLSRVGNFALDLPDADVLVEVSGIYGSRQEEAQRLGRVLRPKADGRAAKFFTLVSSDTCETRFARKRQRFLTEQGYTYRIVGAHEPWAECATARASILDGVP